MKERPPKNEVETEIKSRRKQPARLQGGRHGRAPPVARPCHHARPDARPCVWPCVAPATAARPCCSGTVAPCRISVPPFPFSLFRAPFDLFSSYFAPFFVELIYFIKYLQK
uniref:Uncharacterized protein n=1 Tax=Opuntia streptacantha TaxID=393608 RepID=A0A7C9EAH6_OPUST